MKRQNTALILAAIVVLIGWFSINKFQDSSEYKQGLLLIEQQDWEGASLIFNYGSDLVKKRYEDSYILYHYVKAKNYYAEGNIILAWNSIDYMDLAYAYSGPFAQDIFRFYNDLEPEFKYAIKHSSSTSTSTNSGSSSGGEGPYYCMGKGDTCKNKTYSPTDFFCSSCDRNNDNVED